MFLVCVEIIITKNLITIRIKFRCVEKFCCQSLRISKQLIFTKRNSLYRHINKIEVYTWKVLVWDKTFIIRFYSKIMNSFDDFLLTIGQRNFFKIILFALIFQFNHLIRSVSALGSKKKYLKGLFLFIFRKLIWN